VSLCQGKNCVHTVSSPTVSGMKTQAHGVEGDKDCSVSQSAPTLPCVWNHSESETKHSSIYGCRHSGFLRCMVLACSSCYMSLGESSVGTWALWFLLSAVPCFAVTV